MVTLQLEDGPAAPDLLLSHLKVTNTGERLHSEVDLLLPFDKPQLTGGQNGKPEYGGVFHTDAEFLNSQGEMDFFSVSWQIMTVEAEGMERILGGRNKHVRQEIYTMRHCLYAVV